MTKDFCILLFQCKGSAPGWRWFLGELTPTVIVTWISMQQHWPGGLLLLCTSLDHTWSKEVASSTIRRRIRRKYHRRTRRRERCATKILASQRPERALEDRSMYRHFFLIGWVFSPSRQEFLGISVLARTHPMADCRFVTTVVLSSLWKSPSFVDVGRRFLSWNLLIRTFEIAPGWCDVNQVAVTRKRVNLCTAY